MYLPINSLQNDDFVENISFFSTGGHFLELMQVAAPVGKIAFLDFSEIIGLIYLKIGM